ncbi:MAG: type II toxin-antitoxin system death-on-curing family toxin [Candidatus Omnitrophica bacterium]|nr:type II toxin-antitoxin system death-on-curing family toxin [Candidatus Omnitrophota bacterium]MBU1783834.1 type II toxin-antitoxin system death-on-curing family toxin [Candidatus Omnitrophota bacterium]MBU1851835.1 type II toxin-antitoxin system death-on-curing family toxin [Candidatus Omnitrophota bacterium]
MVESISLKEVEFLAFELAQKILELNEPIPDFSTRFPDKLESCIATPFVQLSGYNPYPTLIDKAGILFYLMIKNHPFANGNKRIAVTTLLLFLQKNKKWIKIDAYSLYRFTLWIAESPGELKDDVVNVINGFLKKHIITAWNNRGHF